MLPSPSLGPPLLSASWSPPLPCGIALDDGGGGGGGGALLVGGAAGGAGGCVLGAGWVFGVAAGLDAGTVLCVAGACVVLAAEQPAASTPSSATTMSDLLSCGGIIQAPPARYFLPAGTGHAALDRTYPVRPAAHTAGPAGSQGCGAYHATGQRVTVPDGSQYTDVTEPRGSEYANLVHLDRSEYTQSR